MEIKACPICHSYGLESGDQCKVCGYDDLGIHGKRKFKRGVVKA